MSFKDVQQKISKLEEDFQNITNYKVPEDFDVMKGLYDQSLNLSEKVSSIKKKAMQPDDINVYGAKTRSVILEAIPQFELLFLSISSKFEEVSRAHEEYLAKRKEEREANEQKIREEKEKKEKELRLKQEEELRLKLEEDKRLKHELEMKLQRENELKMKERAETELRMKYTTLNKELIEIEGQYQIQLTNFNSLQNKINILCDENNIDQSNLSPNINDLTLVYTNLQNDYDHINDLSIDQIRSNNELSEYSLNNFPELCIKIDKEKRKIHLKKGIINQLSLLIKQKESNLFNVNQIIQENRKKTEEIKLSEAKNKLQENLQKFSDQFPKDNIFLSSSELYDLPIISPNLIEELTETTYINKIKNTRITCVVDWYMESCPPCSMIAPEFERLSQEYSHIKFFRINGPNCVSISYGYGITSYPTFQFYYNGEIVSIFTGANIDILKDNLEKINDKVQKENIEKILTYHDLRHSMGWEGIEIPIMIYWGQFRSSSDYSKALQILSPIIDNLIKYPNNEKFRRLKRQNPKIQQLLSTDGSTPLLYSMGFKNKLVENAPHLVIPSEVDITKNKYINKIKKLIDDGLREQNSNQSQQNNIPVVPNTVPHNMTNDPNLLYLFQDPQIIQDLMMSPTVQSIQANPTLRSRLISRDYEFFRNNPNFQNDPYLMRAMNRLIDIRRQNVIPSQMNTTHNRNIQEMTEDELIEEAIRQSKLEEENKQKDGEDSKSK